ncbi:hypothetical protein ACSVDA_02360 [Cytobacillus sp. Hm23]
MTIKFVELLLDYKNVYILPIIQDLGLQITPEHYNAYADAVLGILILLGIINNPTTKNKGFGGDKE